MPKLYSISAQEAPESVPAEAATNLAMAAIALRQGRPLLLPQKRNCNKLGAFAAFLVIKAITESKFCLEASLYQSKRQYI